MAHTNETEKYGLSQFLATDKPAWLVDYNTDMMKIDMNMNGLQEQVTANLEEYHSGEGALDARVTQCESDIVALDGRTTALEGRMDSAEGRLDVDEANIVGSTNRIGVLEGKVADLENGQGLANGSVDTDILKDHSVTTDKLAFNSVTTDEILNGTIQYEDLSSDLVRHLINVMHPVNSLYLCMGSDNPNNMFAGTTWVRQSGGVLYMGNGTNDGTTTGNNSKTLTTANLPSHNHSFSGGGTVNTGNPTWGSGTPSPYVKIHSTSSGTEGTLYTRSGSPNNSTGENAYGSAVSPIQSGAAYADSGALKSGSWNHTHSVSVSGSIGNTGSGTAFDVQQAGMYVSVWKRTA